MPTNRLSKILGISTFGESHGTAIGILIDSPLPNIPIPFQAISEALARRKPSTHFETARQEPDEIEFLSGVFEGKTTGTPLCVIIRNQDAKSGDYDQVKGLFRPGYADFAWFKKYGIYDYRGGGRASGRETVARIIAASLQESILGDIHIDCQSIQIGELTSSRTQQKPDNPFHWTGE
ncbi:MAG TPA: chorismate synthase, partial [Candidatus Cloacimonadota bacterium]|nr:chorismate synthase [Candidatus Cloacimonadota bacterium]